nr:retrotransposon protein, putative, Ty1-copia subclass [Tanacetum cinerariifolium]
MVPTKKFDKTPYKVCHGQAPKLSYLKVWGYEALVKHDILTKHDKLELGSTKCIFIAYPKEMMGYSFYYPPENKVFVAQNAKFLENSLIVQEASESLEDLKIIQEEDTHPSIETRLIDDEEHELGDLGKPANNKVVLLDHESKKWLNVMNVEMQSMKENKVWELVDLSPNGKTVGHKWLFKKKTDMDGAVYTYKARLVAKGVYSPSVQATLNYMAKAVLGRFPEVSSIQLRMPNIHFLPVNLSSKVNPVIVKFEDDVYLPTDEPHDMQPTYPEYEEEYDDDAGELVIEQDFQSQCDWCKKEIDWYQRESDYL